MFDLDTLLQTIITSGVIAGALSFIFKTFTEKRIEHVFDRKMKEYEAKLQEITEKRIEFAKQRILEYKKLSELVISVRRDAVNLCKKPVPPLDELSSLSSKVKDLEKTISATSITLQSDAIYEKVHKYKIQVDALEKGLENEIKLREKNEKERADSVRKRVNRSLEDIKSECKSIIDLLVGFIQPKSDS